MKNNIDNQTTYYKIVSRENSLSLKFHYLMDDVRTDECKTNVKRCHEIIKDIYKTNKLLNKLYTRKLIILTKIKLHNNSNPLLT